MVAMFKKFICSLVHSFKKYWLATVFGAGLGTAEVNYSGS